MKIGFIQFHPEFGKKEKNVEKAVGIIRDIDADLIVLPELFNSGYLFTSAEEVENISEDVPSGYTTQSLLHVAKDTDTFIVAGLAEKAEGARYNSAVLLGPEGFVGLYRKAHLFKDEVKWFEKGDTGFNVHDIGLARIGMMICFDWIFPEAARTLALKGADIICHPSNLMLPFCQKAMITRSLENGVFSLTCNRVGVEERGGERLEFTGLSQIVDPKGNVLALASEDEEGTQVVEIDPMEARDKTVGINKIFQERRTDLYELS
ncbi:MAG: acyltransferase [Gemmatimonadota bacterium]|nr:MAG: acyltransferase [Gemmatimonadota bacterium]